MNRQRDALLFRIVLRDVHPQVWRQIWVPARYSFWDLHVAIQDAMGWRDYHLHEFELSDGSADGTVTIGIPDDEWPEDREVLAGWRTALADYLGLPGTTTMRYRYDFGDDWVHDVTLEAVARREKGVRYPRCVAGENACPPEDCGGAHGYADLLRVLRDPGDPEHASIIEWLPKGWRPDAFDPDDVIFANPTRRWRYAFGG
jgi:hypothetical protein